MACNICGSPRHEATTAGCPNPVRVFMPIPRVGWLCPACNKGNAPDAKMCGHCTSREMQVVEVVSDTSMSGKINHVGAGDMTHEKQI